MEVREQITLEQIRAAKPSTIWYGANTCWWTHDMNHLRVNGRFGPPPKEELQQRKPEDIIPRIPVAGLKGRTVNPGSIPTDPRGGVLFMTDDVEGFLKAAEEEAAKGPSSHYGTHGLRAFMAAHHLNCVKDLVTNYPWCDQAWHEYNMAIDRMDARKN